MNYSLGGEGGGGGYKTKKIILALSSFVVWGMFSSLFILKKTNIVKRVF